MIGIGETAPEFEARDSRGELFKLSSLRGSNVILYFFPKAFTGGCTMETKQFAALSPSLWERGAQVVGISIDTAETQRKFADSCQAPFPIVSDDTKAIARSYGVLSFVGVTKRVTFYIDKDGIVRDVVSSLLPGPHVSRAKELFIAPK